MKKQKHYLGKRHIKTFTDVPTILRRYYITLQHLNFKNTCLKVKLNSYIGAAEIPKVDNQNFTKILSVRNEISKAIKAKASFATIRELIKQTSELLSPSPLILELEAQLLAENKDKS